MKGLINFLLYDRADRALLSGLDEIAGGARKHLRKLFDPSLHPRGIKELAAPRELRIVYAMFKVLESHSIDRESVDQRLAAFKSLRDEVLDGIGGSLRLNTARVLLHTMKLLLRPDNSPEKRLSLAHELRMALIGQPRFIRRQLRRHHLLEMPEQWNQLTFDGHVHDASTKGRKTPTHLIMDAWIKGIRQLQVVYYNHVPALAAKELLEAAEIMGVEVRIGVEFTTVFRGRFISLIWAPRGFSSSRHFLAFLEKEEVKSFSFCCAEASEWRRDKVLEQLARFNREGRIGMNQRYGIELPELNETAFLESVGAGQPSMLHLSEFIAGSYARHLNQENPDSNALTPEFVNDNFLDNSAVSQPPEDVSSLPEMMRLSMEELSRLLCGLPAGCRLTLNLSNCGLADVIETLYDCHGRISHLEIFNLKDYKSGKSPDIAVINAFRQALNSGNAIRLKHIIRDAISSLEATGSEAAMSQAEALRRILRDIPGLVDSYSRTPLAVRLGSDSTGRYRSLHGMGMVVVDTLPSAMRRRIRGGEDRNREIIPVSAAVSRCQRIAPSGSRSRLLNGLFAFGRAIGAPFGFGYSKRMEWKLEDQARSIGGRGNIATLGGLYDEVKCQYHSFSIPELWNRLNSNVKIAVKVMMGFIPAFLCFFFTKDWWLLSWGGAFIWLGITGIRNIIQAVLGGGGLKRSDLLKWNDFISWQRIADSLFYTGLSVPLLDLGVKTMLLEQTLGLKAEAHPVLVYSAMAFINGCYISSHNIFRGLPKTAATANFFRAILSIPLAILFSIALSGLLAALRVPNHGAIVQQWAAVISKLASDCVAGVIEGYADRLSNIRLRLRDYRYKLSQLFNAYSKLELMFPDDDVSDMLKSTKRLMRAVSEKGLRLEHELIINAMDMLYFKMYQPQAENALRTVMGELAPDERDILIRSQSILDREKEISQMFIDGLVGKHFARALSFYLDHHQDYLKEMNETAAKNHSRIESSRSSVH